MAALRTYEIVQFRANPMTATTRYFPQDAIFLNTCEHYSGKEANVLQQNLSKLTIIKA